MKDARTVEAIGFLVGLIKERDGLRYAVDCYREAAELTAAQKEIAELKEALDVEREQGALAREARIGLKAEMDAELADLRKHLGDRGARIATLETDCAILRSEVSLLKATCDSKDTRIDMLRRERDDAWAEIRELYSRPAERRILDVTVRYADESTASFHPPKGS